MATDRERKIINSYRLHDDDDVSTERLLQMVADDCNCKVDEVADVIMSRKVIGKKTWRRER